MPRRICIVPARKGSKRLPNKNIKILGDKPLFLHTLDLVCGFFDKTIFSTDCEKMQSIARGRQFNGEVQISSRPPELASDTSKVIDTIRYHLDEEMKQSPVDEVWWALPTCPIREMIDIRNSIMVLNSTYDSIEYGPILKGEGVISVTDYDFPPTLAMIFDKTFMRSWYYKKPWENGNTRTQDQQRLYRPNGSLYGIKTDAFLKKGFYNADLMPYFMSKDISIDIDTQIEFDLAELILNRRNNKNE